MAKVVFQDTQRYHQPFIFGLLGILGMLVVFRLVQDGLQGQLGLQVIFGCVAILASVAGAWWYLNRLRFTVRISKKKIILSTNGTFSRKHKIPLKKVKQIDFVRFSPASLWSGWMVHLPSQFRSYDFGDRCAMHVEMKNGEEFLIFSDKLYQERSALSLTA